MSYCCLPMPCVNDSDSFQAYWTPPESEGELPGIPALPPVDPRILSNAPRDLLRSSSASAVGGRRPPPHPRGPATAAPTGHSRFVWGPPEDDSGPIPSDIEIVNSGSGGGAGPVVAQPGAMPGAYPPYGKYPLSDYRPALLPPSHSSPSLSRIRGYPPPPSSAGDAGSTSGLSPRSARRRAPDDWLRSYQNPIGTVYHGPGEDGLGWGAAVGDSSYMSPTSPIYSTAEAYRGFLPSYPAPVPYHPGGGVHLSPSDSHVPRMRDTAEGGVGSRVPRPISADVGRLFSVQEDLPPVASSLSPLPPVPTTADKFKKGECTTVTTYCFSRRAFANSLLTRSNLS